MKKKRREIPEAVILGQHSAGGSWVKSLSGGGSPEPEQGAVYLRYGICPVFGQGEILHFQWEDMEMIISRLSLRQDIVLQHSLEEECLQLSFLVEGEKVITSEGASEFIQQQGESYLASLSGFRGSVRLGCERPFKEIKIRIGSSPLARQNIMTYLNPQKLTDQKQIRPITPELFTILVDLERRDLSTPVQWIYLRAKVLELLALQLENYRKEFPETKDGYGSLNLRKLYQVRKKITDHLHMNFSLARLAAEAGINPNLLNEEFYQVFGLSVHEFGTRAKMERARQLLARSDRLIYQIAEAVGYKNATHFSAAFKRNFGKTPKQYRNSF